VTDFSVIKTNYLFNSDTSMLRTHPLFAVKCVQVYKQYRGRNRILTVHEL